MPFLNAYQKVWNPRVKITKARSSNANNNISKHAFNAFLEICKCPICLDVMRDPVKVIKWMHKFCKNCITTTISGKMKECPIWRIPIGSKRIIDKDHKIESIIKQLIPDLDQYHEYEQAEAVRQLRSEISHKRKKEHK